MLFSKVVGLYDIKKKLINSVNQNRIHHAHLFVENHGSGALALALAYIQYISCENKQEQDSCGECSSCIKINKLIHSDIHFIFPIIALKNSENAHSVDFINEWRQFVNINNAYIDLNKWLEATGCEKKQFNIYTSQSQEIHDEVYKKPYESNFKFFVIWHAEKMGKDFANKILKELEEPPTDTIFILISDSVANILPTIISRCQILKTPKPNQNEIIEYLKQKYSDIEENKAHQISYIANGDIIRLHQIIEEQDSQKELTSLFSTYMRLCWDMSKQYKELLKFVDNISSKNREYQKNFIEYSLNMMRENFIYNISDQRLNYMFENESKFSFNFAKYIRENNINTYYKELTKAKYHIERNVNSKLVFLDLSYIFYKLLNRAKIELDAK